MPDKTYERQELWGMYTSFYILKREFTFSSTYVIFKTAVCKLFANYLVDGEDSLHPQGKSFN